METANMKTAAVESRALGKTGMRTPPLAFGGNVFGWTADERTSHALLDRFVDAGFNLVDTADVYSTWVPGHAGGESESIIGRWIATRGQRDRLLIATKVGKPMGADNRGLSAGYIARAVDASLRRLNTDYIDLYQSHDFDPDTPLEETLGAFARLIDAGKVRWIGASNHSAAQLAQALDVSTRFNLPRYRTLQPLYNLYDRDAFEGELAALCAREDIGVINYYALASGFLTGKYRSEADVASSARATSNAKYLNARGLRILAALDDVGARLGATPAQVAIAWLIAQPGVTAPIASATSRAQLDELLAATRLVLDADALAALGRASAPAPA
jgi:aryl-alcohol dehydrogenase-like predicted oxidoreductase